jgi:hypothetical protein
MIHKLGEAREPILQALLRMVSKPARSRPFVVVNEYRGWNILRKKRFVQFCGSSGEPVIFDVPALRVSKVTTLEDAPEQAIRGLRTQGMTDDDCVTITEDEQGDGDGERRRIRLLVPA